MSEREARVRHLGTTPDLIRCQNDVRKVTEDTTDFRCPDPASHTYTDEYGTHSVCEGCKAEADGIIENWPGLNAPIGWTSISAVQP